MASSEAWVKMWQHPFKRIWFHHFMADTLARLTLKFNRKNWIHFHSFQNINNNEWCRCKQSLQCLICFFNFGSVFTWKSYLSHAYLRRSRHCGTMCFIVKWCWFSADFCLNESPCKPHPVLCSPFSLTIFVKHLPFNDLWCKFYSRFIVYASNNKHLTVRSTTY